ncbi:DUF4329 domain-containing protein [Chryseobacterium arthrosphaerae]|uniref:DUF4329 domain-containing protein n=1 Tax=Chryseobacterium arthrosphaerae TaxID=651561 RepID=UPI0030B8FFAE
MDKAAENFGMQYNGISINVNREYVTKFYSETDAGGNVNYAYVTPVQGGPAGANPSSVTLPTGKTEEGIAHSHGAYDVNYDNNNFSGIPGDKTGSDDIGYSERHNIPIYVATPNGSFQKYNNTNDTISTLRTDLPSDANDPTRLNTINPAPMLPPPPPPPTPVTTP